jgi:hypothetical protein
MVETLSQLLRKLVYFIGDSLNAVEDVHNHFHCVFSLDGLIVLGELICVDLRLSQLFLQSLLKCIIFITMGFAVRGVGVTSGGCPCVLQHSNRFYFKLNIYNF